MPGPPQGAGRVSADYPSQQPSLSRFVDVPGEFQNFDRLHKFLYKLFMQVRFDPADFCLRPVEREIIRLVVQKRRFVGHNQVEFSPAFFDRCSASGLRKKKEDGLKFAFKKTLNHLMSAFRARLSPAERRGSQEQLERRFYEHYFGKVSRQLGIPLERFFHFRNWRNRFSDLIPKSITKEYVARIKLSKEFMGRFRAFLDEHYLGAFYDLNMRKIKRMVGVWDKELTAYGSVAGLARIKARLAKPGNKMPWTLSEATKALEDTYGYLK